MSRLNESIVDFDIPFCFISLVGFRFTSESIQLVGKYYILVGQYCIMISVKTDAEQPNPNVNR